MRHALLSLALLATAARGFALFAQSPATAGFDAVSIKMADPNARGYGIQPLPGRIVAENVSLRNLIGEAYHVLESQISGPKWIDSERYNITGTTGTVGTPDKIQVRQMLQAMLADRFALRIRHEPKVTAVFLLETLKGDHKLKRPATPDAPVHFRLFQRRQITAVNASLDHLTEALTWLLGQPVLDRTGLEGGFDFQLEWSPDEMQTRSTEAPVEIDGKSTPLPSAIQSQLGLKLTSKKEALDQIIVENAKHPSSN